MSLSLHVFRRGAVYWWRRRISDLKIKGRVGSRPRLLSLSLKTHDPKTARCIGAVVSAQVMAAELSGEWRMLNDEQMRTIIRNKIMEYSQVYARTRAVERDGPMKLDAVDGAREDRLHAWALQILSEQGVVAASVTELDRQRMTAQGLNDDDQKSVSDILRMHFSGVSTPSTETGVEHAKRNFFSESTSVYRDILLDVGITPSSAAIREVERVSYLAQAAALRESANERMASTGEMALAEDIAREVAAGSTTAQAIPKLALLSHRSAVSDVSSPSIADCVSEMPATQPNVLSDEPRVEKATTSIIGLVEDYVTERERLGEITTKTRRQYEQTARLLVKVLKDDDASAITGNTINRYRDCLGKLPKNYGKSPADAELSLEQLLARAKKLPADEVGFSGGTINRHITQLTSILDVIERRVGKINDKPEARALRAKKPKDLRNRDKRVPLSEEALIKIFALPVWTGHDDNRSRLRPGNTVIHDALYWIPILGYYMGARRGEISGMKLKEVMGTAAVPHVQIRENEIRGVKTASSTRDVPLHPEILRLGFLEYVQAMERKGHTLLFPELKLRAPNTDMGDTFYGDFKKLLKFAKIPPEWGKDFHGMRHRTLGSLKQAGVSSEIRGDVAGHRGQGVTEEDYGEGLTMTQLLETIKMLPVLTKGIGRKETHYSSWLNQPMTHLKSARQRPKHSGL